MRALPVPVTFILASKSSRSSKFVALFAKLAVNSTGVVDVVETSAPVTAVLSVAL